MSCPVCNVLKGERAGLGKLCKDCRDTKGLSELIRNYKFAQEHLIIETWYVFGTPILMAVCFVAWFVMKCKFEMINFVAWLVIVFIWYKTVFYWNLKMQCGLKDIKKQIAKYKDDMFICKCASEKEEINLRKG